MEQERSPPFSSLVLNPRCPGSDPPCDHPFQDIRNKRSQIQANGPLILLPISEMEETEARSEGKKVSQGYLSYVSYRDQQRPLKREGNNQCAVPAAPVSGASCVQGGFSTFRNVSSSYRCVSASIGKTASPRDRLSSPGALKGIGEESTTSLLSRIIDLI